MIVKIINVISISAEIIIWLMIFLLYAANVMKYIALFSNIDPNLLSWNKYFLFMIYYSFLYWWIHANILINIFHMFMGDFSLIFSSGNVLASIIIIRIVLAWKKLNWGKFYFLMHIKEFYKFSIVSLLQIEYSSPVKPLDLKFSLWEAF